MKNIKKCTRCLKEKDLSNFNKYKRNEKVFVKIYCKSCCSNMSKQSMKKEIKCFRCGKFEFKSNNNKYCSSECRYDAQMDRCNFKRELGLLKFKRGSYLMD